MIHVSTPAFEERGTIAAIAEISVHQTFHSVDPTQSQKLDMEPWPINSSKKPSSKVRPDGARSVGIAFAAIVEEKFSVPVGAAAVSGAPRRIASKNTPRNTPAES